MVWFLTSKSVLLSNKSYFQKIFIGEILRFFIRYFSYTYPIPRLFLITVPEIQTTLVPERYACMRGLSSQTSFLILGIMGLTYKSMCLPVLLPSTQLTSFGMSTIKLFNPFMLDVL